VFFGLTIVSLLSACFLLFSYRSFILHRKSDRHPLSYFALFFSKVWAIADPSSKHFRFTRHIICIKVLQIIFQCIICLVMALFGKGISQVFTWLRLTQTTKFPISVLPWNEWIFWTHYRIYVPCLNSYSLSRPTWKWQLTFVKVISLFKCTIESRLISTYPRVLEVNFKNIYSGLYMKKERVGHSFLGKIEFGTICMFLERTDAIVYLHILYLQYLHCLVPLQWVSLKKMMFLYLQVLENFARQGFLFVCLFVCLFWVARAIFHSYLATVNITGDMAANLDLC
jgi:hypothetical protein